MLETLVRPRIRRALLEYVLTHPHERFYLRGLAKDLDLSVSPLRRELKRLEHAGMLKTVQEANILFYVVDTQSSAFRQLQHVGLTEAPFRPQTTDRSPQIDLESAARTSPLRVQDLSWHSPLSTPALVGATAVGMALLLVVAGLFYFAMTEKRLASQLATRKAAVTVVAPATEASGTMRGNRWQIVPGSFGGFSSGANSESF